MSENDQHSAARVAINTVMLSEAEIFYRALLNRDARFDGRFFTGVVTTGIYCRPICPAPTPKPQNVRFYPCASAAEAAGFRACRRCRPEFSPSTPAWLGTSATVSRALRLIAAGGLDDANVEHLAARLGVGDRHLRRLFAEHLGASPVEIAQTRRTHFARKLIDETQLPMTAVALQAGFSSVRRFNGAIRGAFGRSPTELRRASRSDSNAHPGGGLLLKLPYRPPLDWPRMLGFLAARAIPGIEHVAQGAYHRTIRLIDSHGTIQVYALADKPCLLLNLQWHASPALLPIVERARQLFDLNADLMGINQQIGRDRLLRPLIKAHPGLRPLGAWDPFELAVRAVLGQQVSVQGARTLAARLVERFGTRIADSGAGPLTHLFPRPDVLADAEFASIGLTRQRAVTIRALSRAVCDGRINWTATGGLDDGVVRLTELPGIGPWTAHYIAMRALGEPDAFPASDLGIRKAISAGGRLLSPGEAERRAEVWRPWRAYAVMHLWTSDVTSPKAKRKQQPEGLRPPLANLRAV